jgi:hypothetical protein
MDRLLDRTCGERPRASKIVRVRGLDLPADLVGPPRIAQVQPGRHKPLRSPTSRRCDIRFFRAFPVGQLTASWRRPCTLRKRGERRFPARRATTAVLVAGDVPLLTCLCLNGWSACTGLPQTQPSPPATGPARSAVPVSGWPSIAEPSRLIIGALRYWIARSRAGRRRWCWLRATCLADVPGELRSWMRLL